MLAYALRLTSVALLLLLKMLVPASVASAPVMKYTSFAAVVIVDVMLKE
jgi:hypothetical protein